MKRSRIMTEGNLISKGDARRLILDKYQVPDEIRRERRRRNTKSNRKREPATVSIYEAAKAPQTVQVMSVSRE
jgi:hypothetical protein